jgi:hypothetical protein
MSLVNAMGGVLFIAGFLSFAVSFRFRKRGNSGTDQSLNKVQLVFIFLSAVLILLGGILLGNGRPMI